MQAAAAAAAERPLEKRACKGGKRRRGYREGERKSDAMKAQRLLVK
jgi:hypothetical protein